MRHGATVQEEYVDLADSDSQAKFSDVLDLVKDQNLPYPLVAINGELRLAGSAHYFRVLPLVDELLGEPAERTQG